jgi:hypothetical protein
MLTFGNLAGVCLPTGYIGVFGTVRGRLFELSSDDGGHSFRWKDVKTPGGSLKPGISAVAAPPGFVSVYGFQGSLLVEYDATGKAWHVVGKLGAAGSAIEPSPRYQTRYGGISFYSPSAVVVPPDAGYTTPGADDIRVFGVDTNRRLWECRPHRHGQKWNQLPGQCAGPCSAVVTREGAVLVYSLSELDQRVTLWHCADNKWFAQDAGPVLWSDPATGYIDPVFHCLAAAPVPATPDSPAASNCHIFVGSDSGLYVGKRVPLPKNAWNHSWSALELRPRAQYAGQINGPPAAASSQGIGSSFKLHAREESLELWEFYSDAQLEWHVREHGGGPQEEASQHFGRPEIASVVAPAQLSGSSWGYQYAGVFAFDVADNLWEHTYDPQGLDASAYRWVNHGKPRIPA